LKTKEEILIFPYSGTGIEALDCLSETQSCIGFISDDTSIIGSEQYGVKVYGREAFEIFPDAKVLAVNGSPVSFKKRKPIIDGLKIDDNRFTTLIHPQAIVGKNVKLGKNVLIMAGVVITANAEVGNHICILPNTVIHHDSKIGDYTLIAANNTVCGDVSIGENCYLGASSSFKNGVKVGKECLIGIGSNVVGDINNNVTAMGNPAKEYFGKTEK
jgi:sugar O-acyltransferase (sialic acid O-acetyltransferase NeuD family)